MHISSFLDKFKKIKDPKKDLVIAGEVLSKIFGADLRSVVKDIRKGILYIDNNTQYKTEMFLRKELILDAVKKSLPEANITDLR